jgi:hypothetical protein
VTPVALLLNEPIITNQTKNVLANNIRSLKSIVYLIECQCNFPASLRGSWNGADRGIMTFENSSFLTSYTSANTANLPATLDFNCFEKQEKMFLLK